MAKERTSVRMQTQIKTLSEQGYSIRSIARILRLSRRTVCKYLEPTAQPPSDSGGWVDTVDWDSWGSGLWILVFTSINRSPNHERSSLLLSVSR